MIQKSLMIFNFILTIYETKKKISFVTECKRNILNAFQKYTLSKFEEDGYVLNFTTSSTCILYFHDII